MSPDDLNEKLMWYNKSPPRQHSFTKKCERSNLILLLRKCGYAAFGKRNTRSKHAPASRERDVCRLMELFEKANLFPLDCAVKREFTPDFFWDLIDRNFEIGTQKEKDDEKVERSDTEEFG